MVHCLSLLLSQQSTQKKPHESSANTAASSGLACLKSTITIH